MNRRAVFLTFLASIFALTILSPSSAEEAGNAATPSDVKFYGLGLDTIIDAPRPQTSGDGFAGYRPPREGYEITRKEAAPCFVLPPPAPPPRIDYRGWAIAPLEFPPNFRSPRPGVAGGAAPRKVGPSVGPIPSTNPLQHRIGNSFYFTAQLNGVHGCTSQQRDKALWAVVHKQTGLVIGSRGGGFGPAAWRQRIPQIYRGDTRTGLRVTFYEGTQNRFDWIDSPGINLAPPAQLAEYALILGMVIESRVENSPGVWFTGAHCITGHTFIMDLATGAPMPAPAARAMMANLLPFPMPVFGPDPTLAETAQVFSTPAANGGYQGVANPEFRLLVCQHLL
jgi:hypothetical protein